jgi:predicted SprT family Zn-dependent metalloprotease
MTDQEIVSYDTNDEDDDIDSEFNPTNRTYSAFREAFAVFNLELFDDKLPDCLITLQRRRNTRGCFGAQRFGHRVGSEIVDEIALNPAAFRDRTDRQIASTLVHEMVHQWQYRFGKPSRSGYHNKEWAAKMVEVGLIPSDTGEPGGKRTGQRVSHYIEEGGLFDRVWNILASDAFSFDYQDRATNRSDTPPRKLKASYFCHQCDYSLWGQPGHRVVCGDCNQQMEERAPECEITYQRPP